MLELGFAASKGDVAAFPGLDTRRGSGRKAMDQVRNILRPGRTSRALMKFWRLLTRIALDLGLQPVTVESARQSARAAKRWSSRRCPTWTA